MVEIVASASCFLLMDGLPKDVRKKPSAFVLHRFFFVYVNVCRGEVSTNWTPFLFRAIRSVSFTFLGNVSELSRFISGCKHSISIVD